MAEQQPTFVDDLCYFADDLKWMQAGLVCSDGVGEFTDLYVSETSPPSGSINVTAGHAFVRTNSVDNGGVYHVYNDDDVPLVVPLNSTGSDRTDYVWVQICDSEFAAVTSGFTLIYDVAPATTPPTDGCTYYLLATVVVPNGAGTGGTNITGSPDYFGDADSMITDNREAFQLCGDNGGWVQASASLDFPSIAANGGRQTGTITVRGASVGDPVAVGAQTGLAAGLVWNGFVSATDTVSVQVTNTSGSPIDPASGTWNVAVKIR